MSALLQVEDLHVTYPGGAQALRGVSLRVEPGQTVAVVGESGSGKSTLARALAGLVRPPLARGRVALDGEDLLTASPQRQQALRWSRVALAVQGAPFNPVVRVGDQIAEPLRVHRGVRSSAALGRARQLAEEVMLDPAALDRYPHELSGGERQRALLAMVLTLDPGLVVLDEPTAGQDALNRQAICARLGELAASRGFALVLVSHDLPAAAALCTQARVLYAGRFVEAGPTAAVLGDPAHPYTWALVNASPVMSTTKDLRPIRGTAPDSREPPAGCAFHPRCTQAVAQCQERDAELAPVGAREVACHLGGLRVLLEARGLTKTFVSARRTVPALRGVGLRLREGEAVGVVWASGSGKSTLARLLAADLAPDTGEVWVQGVLVPRSWGRADRPRRRQVQLVLQNPWDALSPRLCVQEILDEPLALSGTGPAPVASPAQARQEALAAVGLPTGAGFLAATTHELSGGQQQRLALARALLAQPRVLIADEPTAMLDGSEQARLLVLLRDLQVQRGMGLVLVSHDLAAVRKVTDRIVVLDAGRVVESGPSHLVAGAPRAEVTRRLLGAAATLDHTAGHDGPGDAQTTDEGVAEDVG